MKNQTKIILIATIAVVSVGIFAIFFNILNDQKTFAPEPLSIKENSSQNSSQIATLQSGNIYTASKIYFKVPENHINELTVSINLDENKKILSVDNVHFGKARESTRYKSAFQSRINQETVGKKISDLSLSSVGGASLTTDAFMQAIKEINASIKQ
jgi:hypothetical protein